MRKLTMKLAIENGEVPQYIRHQPKSNCRFCKTAPRVGRSIVRQPTITVNPNSGKFEIEMGKLTDCEYHVVADWLTKNSDITNVHT